MNQDIYTAERHAFLDSIPREGSLAEKVQRQIRAMGSTYLHHRDNHVQRLPEPLCE